MKFYISLMLRLSKWTGRDHTGLDTNSPMMANWNNNNNNKIMVCPFTSRQFYRRPNRGLGRLEQSPTMIDWSTGQLDRSSSSKWSTPYTGRLGIGPVIRVAQVESATNIHVITSNWPTILHVDLVTWHAAVTSTCWHAEWDRPVGMEGWFTQINSTII